MHELNKSILISFDSGFTGEIFNFYFSRKIVIKTSCCCQKMRKLKMNYVCFSCTKKKYLERVPSISCLKIFHVNAFFVMLILVSASIELICYFVCLLKYKLCWTPEGEDSANGIQNGFLIESVMVHGEEV